MKTLACLLLIAGCAIDPDTSTTESDISVSQWTDDQTIANQQTPFQPGVAYFGTKLYAAYSTIPDGTIRLTTFNGSSWTTPKTLALDVAEYGPALAVFQNKLVMLYHAYGQDFLDMATSTDGTSWTSPISAGRVLDGAVARYAPSLAVLDSRLFAAYCVRTASGDRVNVDYFYSTWHAVTSLPVSGECKHVALGARPGDKLDLFVTEYTGDWYMEEAVGISAGDTWPTHLDLVSMRSKKPPSIVTCNGITHLVHGGYSTPDEIWWSYLQSDGTWARDAKVPNQASDGGAALGCFAGTRTMIVHNGGYPQLWWAQFLQ